MTQKLFDLNSYVKEFSAVVTACREDEKKPGEYLVGRPAGRYRYPWRCFGGLCFRKTRGYSSSLHRPFGRGRASGRKNKLAAAV